MGAQDIQILPLVSLFILIFPIIVLSSKMELNISNQIIRSTFRMTIQLSFVGIYLKYLFALNSALINIVYLLFMISIACNSVLRASNIKVKKFFIPVFFSFLIPFGIILVFLNSVVLELDNLFDTKYLVPIGGMLLGNSMRSNIIGLTIFYSGLKKDEKIYLYSISLMGNKIKALAPFFKESIVAAINPTLASIATIGLVSLPGMMTGQILGGSLPTVAIKYQIAIMLSIFYTQYFSVILSVFFSLKIGFNDFDVLKKDIFK
jgi:putative ABC transport system permease protein